MIFTRVRKEFIAKLTADLGKTMFAIGLASYFFEKFPIGVRILLIVICAILPVGSIFIQPKEI